jgi:hypothetical protein
MNANSPTTAARALQDALKFSSADLEANRAGQLSDSQRDAFARRCLIMAGLALAGGIGFLVVYSALPSAPGDSLSPLALILLPVTLAVAAFALFELIATFLKLQRAAVTVSRGKAEIELDPSPRRLFGKLRLGKFEIIVPKDQLVAFHEGSQYAVYYTPAPRHVLSAEFLSD